MNEIITNIRPTFEILYFIASILLLGGLWLTYKQLMLINTDIKIRNQRAAAEKAIEASNRYFTDYIPLSGNYYREKITSKIDHYNGPIGDFYYNSIPKDQRESSLKRYKLSSWLPALNSLESIASSFITGVADESVGFRVIGRTFCSSVEHSYDLISISRQEKPIEYWTNIVELYLLWRPRLTKAELEIEMQEIGSKISKLEQKKAPPIGSSTN